MEALLNLNQPFDVKLLEQVVVVFYDSSHPEQQKANQVLTQLKENIQAWQAVDKILEQSNDQSTKFFALQILEGTIVYRWKALPPEQRDGIKNFVVKKIIDLSTDENTLQQQKVFVSKLNLILVHILKQEWPHNWPSFITDLVASSRTSESLCENNMHILKLLSEEVFDFSKEQMTTQKIKTMKEQLNGEFRQIFELCDLVLRMSQRPSLLTITLQTLLRFLTWIPLGYIFETNLVEQLLTKFLPTHLFRNDTLACLTEIGSLEIPDGFKEKYIPVVQQIFNTFMTQLTQVLLPPNTDIPAAFATAGQEDCVFVQQLSLFFTGILSQHLKLFERPENHNQLLISLKYLVKISAVNDSEIFKICLEFWNLLTKDLYTNVCNQMQQVLMNQHASARKQLYHEILNEVRAVMISKMAKPEEVLVVEDDAGEIIREITKDTDAIAQYKTMRETLVYLTHLDYDETENIMLMTLTAQCKSDFSWNKLNTLCWAIGSISGAMNEENEKRFLVTVIKDLLSLCENKRGKENKAVVASNIMYVVGQYPRFLRAHWKFLRTVVRKLFEFMHELHPGVQDMACDTFLKIAQKCRSKFVYLQAGESQPFVEDLLQNLPLIISDLETHQIQTFYEACAHMISAQNKPDQREALIRNLMKIPNQTWKEIMAVANNNVEQLREPQRVKELARVLRTNVRVCSALGNPYISQLGIIYMDMLNVYKTFSEYISHGVAQQGVIVTKHAIIRSMRGVKVEILKLIEVFVSKSEDPVTVSDQLVVHLYEPVLGDYKRNIATARDAEVLQLFATIVNKLHARIANGVPIIFDAVFDETLMMISANHEDFPEHRISFYELLRAVVRHCFQAILKFNPETVKKIIHAITWGIKHTDRKVSETCLDILDDLLKNVSQQPDFAQQFYQNHLLLILQDVLYVLTDRFHKSGFKQHATILQHIFTIVESGQVMVPLFDTNTVQAASNQQFLREYVQNMMGSAFPHVGKSVLQEFVVGLFDMNKDLNTFKVHLRDFLIRLKEFSAEDNTDLFAEENTKAQQAKAQQEQAQREAIPGLVNPYELSGQDMADL